MSNGVRRQIQRARPFGQGGQALPSPFTRKVTHG